MKRLKKIHVRTLTTALTSVFLAIVATPYLYADDTSMQTGADAARGNGQPAQLFGDAGIFTTISNTLLFVIGALAVVMIVIGGLRYTISAGNSNSVTGAKNTILYAVVGLIVALLAYAIINFVLTTLAGGSAIAPTTT